MNKTEFNANYICRYYEFKELKENSLISFETVKKIIFEDTNKTVAKKTYDNLIENLKTTTENKFVFKSRRGFKLVFIIR